MPVRYSAKSGLWTDPSTWQGGVVPQAGDQVVIQSGHTVTYNVVEGSSYDVELGTASNSLDIDIYGTLRFDTSATQNLRLRFKGYVYVRDGGRFECGTDANPMPPVKVTIQKTVAGYSMFVVANNGQISLSGSPNLPPDGQGGYKIYTTLAAPASSGSNTIVVAEDLNWQVGDYIYMPRAAEVVGAPIYPFGATVNAVTQNQDGTYTLTLSTTLPQNYIAGTHVAKANRLIRIIDVNTTISYYTFNSAANHVPVTSLKWVEFNRAGSVYGVFANPYFITSNPYYAEYLSTTPAGINSGFITTTTVTNICVLYRCVGMLLYITSGQWLYFSECVGGGLWSMVAHAAIHANNCILFTPYLSGNASNQVIITNSICYAPTIASSISADFINCTFYGLSFLQNYNVAYSSIAKFKSCTFRYGCDGTSRPRFDWRSYNTAQRWLELIDCQFYDTWVEPSAFSSNAALPEHRGSHPLPLVRFINKQTTSGTIAEQIFRAGGIITSNDSDVPPHLSNVAYSLDFAPRNASGFPLVYDIPLPPGGEVVIAHKYVSGDVYARIQVLARGDEVLLPTIVTPLQEITLTRETSWAYIKISNPSNAARIVRIWVHRGTSDGVWRFAFQNPIMVLPGALMWI
ncbi:MAG: G8 domain-containing protein [Ignisphaera sp.]